MRLIPILLLTVALAACGREPGYAPRHGGRYVGIGIYSPGQMWQRLSGPARSADESAATLRDDEQVIVVVDSQTGEVRQCGNLSGHCIRMNPWSGQAAPARLDAHRDEQPEGSVTNEATPAVTNESGR